MNFSNLNSDSENIKKAQEDCVVRILHSGAKTEDEMIKLVRRICRDYKVSCRDLKKSNLLEKYENLVQEEKEQKSEEFEKLVTKRKVRTESGVSVISVMTKPLGCPGKCVYCPNQQNMPKSYLDNQPAAMRGVMHDFDPFEQVTARLLMLKKMGHDISKNEVIILGGTFSAHPVKYQEMFVKRIFDAFNLFGNKKNRKIVDNLSLAKKENETTDCRVIGLTIETRPDYINLEELKWLRYLGVTRVELGVQSVVDEVLKLVNRGHDSAAVREATRLLRLAGFKIVYHMMPGLPGATIDSDIKMFAELFNNKGYFPDHLKIYPTVVLADSEMYNWWKVGKYVPYNQEKVVSVLTAIKKNIPEWVRIVRVMRDIPEESVIDGVKVSNLRQLIHSAGVICKCIRCREPKQLRITNYELREIKYDVAGGIEYFISTVSIDGINILALARLFLPVENEVTNEISELKGCAIIRELHTYGVVAGVDKKGNQTQHRGMGKMLMTKAEEMAKNNGYKKMAVIAGVGVRDYYRKIGYRLEGEYMIKDLV